MLYSSALNLPSCQVLLFIFSEDLDVDVVTARLQFVICYYGFLTYQNNNTEDGLVIYSCPSRMTDVHCCTFY
ncbi:hypothetical protein ACET3Z_015904 [Daucus carota]